MDRFQKPRPSSLAKPLAIQVNPQSSFSTVAPSNVKKFAPGLFDCRDYQCPIEKLIEPFAGGFRNEDTTMAGATGYFPELVIIAAA